MPPSRNGGDEFAPMLGFDPEAVLERDSRVLLDPAFLATLHEELARELEPAAAVTALLQMGFLHGLQDVTRVLASSPAPGAEAVFAPPLRMLCRPLPSDGAAGALRIEGDWPDRREAEARLVSLGVGADAACHLSAGYTSGWLTGAFDADLLAIETRCGATGARDCHFVAREAEDWQGRADAGARPALEAIPFAAFRELVRERVGGGSHPASEERPASGGVDRGSTAVHIWGPVLVLPYAGPEPLLQALDLLARDAGASEVSVIVVDLHGAIIDETYGALALEQLVETAEVWGAEVLFVDPSPLCEQVLADLDHPPLLTLKDLEPAVALAFQIARSQRRST